MTWAPSQFRFKRHSYPLFFHQLWRQYGWRALIRQFRFQYRRPWSRKLIAQFAPSGTGIEIGVGFYTIAPLERTLLTDGFATHGTHDSIATHFCKADEIPVADATFDFVLSEHVLEHLSNPLRALNEWRRVLKPHGRIFLFLPHAERTFDRHRARTALSHLIQDFEHGVSDPDLTHLEDWKQNVIRKGLAPHYSHIPDRDHPLKGILHHHVWTEQEIMELLTHLGWKILHSESRVPDRLDSFAVVAEAPSSSD